MEELNMTYDYELRIKPWRELTLLCDFIDSDGLHFENYFLSYIAFVTLQHQNLYCHMYHDGYNKFYNKIGDDLGDLNEVVFTITDKYSTTIGPVIGDNTEEHY